MLVHQSTDSVSNTYHTIRYHNYRRCMHFHRGYEIIYVIQGKIELTTDECRMALSAGDFACILSNQPHQLYTIGESYIWICCFSTDFLPDFHKKVKNCTADSQRFFCDSQLLHFLEEQFFPYEDPEGILLDRYKLKGALYLLCGAYLSSVTLSKRDNSRFELMNAIFNYVEKNYNRKLRMQEVAEYLGYEYSYFSTLFRRAFDIPFTEFLNSYRCGAAVEMLRNTDENIAAIAEKSGFQSVRTFNYVFQKQMGMTPTEYAKLLKSTKSKMLSR